MSQETFAEWAVLELMGHRKLAGYVTEATIAGAGMIRLQVPGEKPGEWLATQFYSPSAVYCTTPTTEELAREVATQYRPAPVTRLEAPALAGAVQRTVNEPGYDPDPDPDIDEPDELADGDREVWFYEPAGELDVEQVVDTLSLAGDHVDQAAVTDWTGLERLMACDYALRVHTRASGAEDIEARPRPSFVAKALVI